VAGIRNQRHRVRQKSEAAFDGHEQEIEAHRQGHPRVDRLSGDAMGMAVTVMVIMRVRVMTMIVLIPTVIVWFHGAYLTSVAAACRMFP
jgi:hypothetical protein